MLTSFRRQLTFFFLAAAATLSGVTGCCTLQRASAPMHATTYRRAPDQRASCLFVMLPGRGDSAEDFERHGFVDAVRASGIDADVTAVDAHFKYYRKRTLIERLHEDVLAPARREGYRHIVLVGISLGGLGSVAMAREHPEDVDALALLSPYLGNAQVVSRVRAEGLAAYVPDDPNDFFQQNWQYLGGYARGEARPALALGYGRREGLAPTLEILAPSVPRERLSTTDGEHGWRTWTPIFERWKRDGTLSALCAAAAPDVRSRGSGSAGP